MGLNGKVFVRCRRRENRAGTITIMISSSNNGSRRAAWDIAVIRAQRYLGGCGDQTKKSSVSANRKKISWTEAAR